MLKSENSINQKKILNIALRAETKLRTKWMIPQEKKIQGKGNPYLYLQFK